MTDTNRPSNLVADLREARRMIEAMDADSFDGLSKDSLYMRAAAEIERLNKIVRALTADSQRIDYDCPDCHRPVVLGDSICPVTKEQHKPMRPVETTTSQPEIFRVLLTEGVKVWCDSPLPGRAYPEYACGKCWTCRVRAALATTSPEEPNGRPLTSEEAAAVEAFGDELVTIYRCQCGAMPGTSISGQLFCTNCGTYRKDRSNPVRPENGGDEHGA